MIVAVQLQVCIYLHQKITLITKELVILSRHACSYTAPHLVPVLQTKLTEVGVVDLICNLELKLL